MSNIHYKKSQYGILITLIFSLITLLIVGFYLFKVGSKPISLLPTIIISLFFLLIIASFYKLTITITDTEIKAKFGIGLIRRSLPIKAIKYNTIKKIKIPALYGIGIRFTPYGILYNVKLGEAIKIESAEKSFFVGTDEAEKIHDILLQLKPLQD